MPVEVIEESERLSTQHLLGRLSPGAREWLKTHTIEDLRALVCELSERGEDVRHLVEVVDEIDKLAHEVGLHEHLHEHRFTAELEELEETGCERKEDIIADEL